MGGGGWRAVSLHSLCCESETFRLGFNGKFWPLGNTKLKFYLLWQLLHAELFMVKCNSSKKVLIRTQNRGKNYGSGEINLRIPDPPLCVYLLVDENSPLLAFSSFSPLRSCRKLLPSTPTHNKAFCCARLRVFAQCRHCFGKRNFV